MSVQSAPWRQRCSAFYSLAEPAMTDTQSVGSTATDEVVSTGLAPDLPNVDYDGSVKHRCPKVLVVYECEYAG